MHDCGPRPMANAKTELITDEHCLAGWTAHIGRWPGELLHAQRRNASTEKIARELEQLVRMYAPPDPFPDLMSETAFCPVYSISRRRGELNALGCSRAPWLHPRS